MRWKSGSTLARERDAEVGPQLREVDFAPGGQIGAAPHALRDVVAVDVGPAQRIAIEREWVVLGRELRRPRLVVAVEAGLERRLRVAEQVVDDADARREVLPCRHRNRIEVALADPPAGARLLLGDLVRQVLPAQPGVDGQSVQRPRVLDEEADVGVQLLLVAQRRVVDRHRDGVGEGRGRWSRRRPAAGRRWSRGC